MDYSAGKQFKIDRKLKRRFSLSSRLISQGRFDDAVGFIGVDADGEKIGSFLVFDKALKGYEKQGLLTELPDTKRRRS